MENARLTIPFLRIQENKYDVVYMNTPFSKLDVNSIGKFPLKEITSENAAIFMWVDPGSIISASKLVEKWDLKMESVIQIADYAKYKWMTPVKENEEESKTKERKYKVPPIIKPSWWVKLGENDKSTTEQLWLLSKGDISSIVSMNSIHSQVKNLPEVGKKSRAKKKESYSAEWNTDRPCVFLDIVMEMVEKNKSVLNAFSSNVEDTKIDVWGPGVPGGFQTCKNGSLMNFIHGHMKSMRKGELQKLSVLSNYSSMSENEKDDVLNMKEMEPIKKILSGVYNPTYNVKEDNGKLTDWAVGLVYTLSCNNITNFSSTRNKKKRKASSKSNKDGPKHGIAAPSSISKELAQFFDKDPEEKMARTEAVSKLNEYILKNKLQNPQNKKEIILDDVLVKLLEPPADFGPVTYFNLCKLVGNHFPKSKKKQKLEASLKESKEETKEEKNTEMKVEEEKKEENTEMKVEEEKNEENTEMKVEEEKTEEQLIEEMK